MIATTDVDELAGALVIDRDGDRIGTVAQVFLSEDGAQPLFVTVQLGPAGAKESFVPLQSAALRDGTLQVAYDGATIASAPDLRSDGAITDDEQGTIFDYYDSTAGGIPSGADGAPAGLSETPEERTVTVPVPGQSIEGDDAGPLGGDRAADTEAS